MLVLLVASFCLWPTAARCQDETRRDAAGFQDGAAYLRVLPWEGIDTYSGGLTLTFTDLRLHGHAGFDLVISRTYNNKPSRWSISVGPPTIHTPAGGHWFVKREDGADQRLYQTSTGSGLYRTTDYWLYDPTLHVLSLPNGMTCKYEYAVGDVAYLTEMKDVFGNTVTVSYELHPEGPLFHQLVQDLGSGQTRSVDFTYDYQDGVLMAQHMTSEGREWIYSWNGAYPQMLQSATAPAGGTWSYSYTGTRLTKVTLPQGGEVTYTYDSDPGLRAIVKRSSGGRAVPAADWTLTYNGAQTVVTTPVGEITYEFGYGSYEGSPSGTITKENGVEVQREAFTWQTSTAVGVEGGVAAGTKPLLASHTTVRDGRTYSTAYSYHDWDFNDYGQPFQIVETGDYARTTTRTFWSSPGDAYVRGLSAGETVTDGTESFTASYDRDPNDPTGFVRSSTVHGVTTTYERDGRGNTKKVTDAKSNVWEYLDFSWGSVGTIRSAGYTIKRGVNSDGTVAWEARDAEGGSFARRTTFAYDGLGRQTSAQPVLGNGVQTNFAWETDASDPHIVTTRGTVTAEAHLDGYGRVTSTLRKGTNPADGTITTTTRFDAAGRRIFESYPFDGGEVGTGYTYDALGRLKQQTAPNGKQTTFAYANGNGGLQVTITEPFGNGGQRTTTQTWAATGDPDNKKLIRVVDAENQETTYAYNVIGNVKTVQSPGISARTFGYYPGTTLLQQETHPEAGATTYEYWANGIVKKKTDAAGNSLTYGYDGNNRLVSVVASADASYDLAITYDDPRSDNRASITNSHVASTFGYDDAGRLTSRTDTIWPGGSQASHTFVTAYVPNADGNIARITYPSTRAVIYQFDSLQRVSSLGDGTSSYATGIRYHPSGQLDGYSSGNGVVSGYTYEPLTYRASTITHTKGSHDVLSLTYAYSDEGNVTSIGDSRAGMSQNFTNGYDRVDRLVSGTGPWGSVAYGYDAVGNRTAETRNGTASSYHYDPIPGGPSNVLTSLSGGRTEAFTPNAIGQTLADGRGSYTYSPTGLMSRAAMFSGVTATYAYDGDDQRAFAVKSGVNHYYVRGAGGQILSEFEEGGGEFRWTADYVYLGDRAVTAVRPGTGALTLTVTKTGGGSGTVTGVPPGIDCGTACQAAYAMGSVVILTATPTTTDTRFAGWEGTGVCAVGSTENPRLLIVTEPTTCTAKFLRRYSLNVTKSGPGVANVVITSEPSGIICAGTCTTTTATFDENVTVTLTRTATPAGYQFLGWSGTGCVPGPGPDQVQVTMGGDRSCTATYSLVSHKVGPADGAEWLGSSVTTSWTASPDSGYWVCVDQTNNNTCDSGQWRPTGYTWSVFEPLAPGTYYWQAKVVTPTGTYEMDEGVWWHFTVGAPGGANFGKSAPAQGATVAPNLTLSWQALTGAPNYEVCWDTTPNNACDTAWQATGTATSYAVNGLTPGTYYWQVRAGGTVLADGGVWWSFVVPLEFHKQGPASGTTWLTSNVTVSWTSVPDSGYWVCVDQTPNNACDTIWYPIGYTSRTYEGLAPGTYYWQVKVQGQSGAMTEADGGAWWTFSVGAPPGTTFSKLGPGSGATVNNSSITFVWTAVSGAPGYEVCWDATLNGGCDGTWYSTGTTTTLTVSGFSTGGYEWQVRAGGTTLADGGSWWTFTIPVLMNKIYPANGATGLGTLVIASWTALPNNGYWVCLDTIDNNQCDTWWAPNGGMTSKWFEYLIPGTTYYWQVRDAAQSIQYDDGVWFHFTVGGGMSPMRGGNSPASDTDVQSLAYGCALDDAVVRCVRRAAFAGAYYRFTLPAADGLQVWVDGQAQTLTRVPAKNSKQTATNTFDVDMRPGNHVVQYEYAASWLTAVTVTWQVTNPPSASSGGQASPLLVVAPAFGFEYYHQDALGSTRVVTDQTGAILRRHDYLPFGEEWPQPSDNDRMLFTGQERDSESGLDYFRARYYRADLGRFTTADPIELSGGDNLYVYVANNPVRFTDPDGLQNPKAAQKPTRQEPDPSSATFSIETVCDKKCQEDLYRQLRFNQFIQSKGPAGNSTPGSIVREGIEKLLMMRDWVRGLSRNDQRYLFVEGVGSICLNGTTRYTPAFELRPAPCGSLGCPAGMTVLVDLHMHSLGSGQQQPSWDDVLAAQGGAPYRFVWTPFNGRPGGAVFQFNAQGAWSVWGPAIPFWPYSQPK